MRRPSGYALEKRANARFDRHLVVSMENGGKGLVLTASGWEKTKPLTLHADCPQQAPS